MEWLLIGGALLIAAKLGKRDAAAPQSALPPPPAEKPKDGFNPMGALGAAGVGVAAVAAAAAGREAGKGVAAITGFAPDSAPGVTAQVTVAGTAALAVLNPIGAIVFLSLGGLLFSILAIVDELNRKAYAEAGGPQRDIERAWSQMHSQAAKGLASANLQPWQVERYASLIADGYILEKNRLNYEVAKKLIDKRVPPEVRVAPTKELAFRQAMNHLRERAYFIGGLDSNGALVNNLELKSRTREFSRKYTPAADRRTRTVRNAAVVVLGRVVVPEQVLELPYDAAEATWFPIGAAFANAANYAEWMATERGLGQSDRSHMAVGQNEGRFVGEGNAQAQLTLNGFVFSWKLPDGKPGLVVLQRPNLEVKPDSPYDSPEAQDLERVAAQAEAAKVATLTPTAPVEVKPLVSPALPTLTLAGGGSLFSLVRK